MRRRVALALLLAVPAGCAPTAEQQAAAFTSTSATTAARARQSRRFDTTDMAMMLQAAIGAMQDIGFVIDESDAPQGVLVGTKLSGALLRGQVILRPGGDGKTIIVRATFQRILPRPGAMLAVGEELDDPKLYQGFFEKLSQSAFLTANDI
jgi:long-subunit fatty acid transport protein